MDQYRGSVGGGPHRVVGVEPYVQSPFSDLSCVVPCSNIPYVGPYVQSPFSDLSCVVPCSNIPYVGPYVQSPFSDLSCVVPCSNIPYVGPYVQSPFSEYLDKQKTKLHRKPGESLVHVSGGCTEWVELKEGLHYLLGHCTVKLFLQWTHTCA